MSIYLEIKEVGLFIAEVKLLPWIGNNKNWKYFLHQLYSSGREKGNKRQGKEVESEAITIYGPPFKYMLMKDWKTISKSDTLDTVLHTDCAKFFPNPSGMLV